MTLLNDLPDVEFAKKDIDEILSQTVSDYEKAHYEQTGERKKLYPGDPIRIFLYTQAYREWILRNMIDYSAKQNLLKYSKGDYLRNLAAYKNVEQLEASAARVPVKFKLSAPQSTNQTIPQGTRVSPGEDIYFSILENTTVEAGETDVIVMTECLEKGEVGNGFTPGQIDILVDPLPWIESVENTETSGGGSDKESYDSLRERTRLAPEGYAVAGPTGAYEFLAKSFSPSIADVYVFSPAPVEVDVRILLQDGEIPEPAFLEEVEEYLNAKDKRPLTDLVKVNAPDVVKYDIDLTYYILSDNSNEEERIKEEVEQTIEKYKRWQGSRIGRDINPSELISRIIRAGAKRVDVIEPSFKQLGSIEVAQANEVNISYGGLEDE